ncbi:MAG TPA: OB-fold domain-containing protein [Solirubrobacteraceae bacterium]|nr:OB-fold domain-containing protein [Solirubrobacteraceae bacterium]
MAAKRTDGRLAVRAFAGDGDPAHLLPPRTGDVAPFWDALREGRLALQRCRDCGRARFPVAPVCPYCGGRSCDWRRLSGKGTVHSWIRYHRGYLPEFAPLMPYAVLCVALDDGPRMFGRLAGDGADPWIGMPVQAIVERFPGGECVPAFVAATPP